ncbi:hypothetical protein OAB94_02325 [Flavobacteriaceae bacterium]|nr:hypothetical protein [Flavobacteriaceae bacterium]
MSLQTINNGTTDNDATAEKIRLAFQKAKEMFTEIYGKIPLELTGQTGKILVVKAAEDGFELVALSGGGDMLSTNNLSDLTNTVIARANLGLGTASITDATAYATSIQGGLADSALQSITAGSGVTIDITDPQNPIVSSSESNDYVVSGLVDYGNEQITLTLLSTGTVNVSIPGIKPVIDGYTVDKGVGNTNYVSIEAGDFCSGWDGTKFVAFRVDSLPYTTEANISYAIQGEI